MSVEKDSYIDRYGRRGGTVIEISADKKLKLQQAGVFGYSLDISLNDTKLKRMGFVLPFGSFRTEIDGKLVEVKQKTLYIKGNKWAKFTVKVDGEVVAELQFSKSEGSFAP